MKRALILTGTGRYADPWHPFEQTSACLAELLTEQGFNVEITGDVDARMAELSTQHPDLLVVNVGDPALNSPDAPEHGAEARGRDGLLSYLDRGGSLLGMHTASTSFRGVPEWKQILGGIWVRGQSFHPDYTRFHVTLGPDAEGITAGLRGFDVEDEAYTHLDYADTNSVLTETVTESEKVPLAWCRTYGSAHARVVYDALGHDTASYDSVGHRALLQRCIRWLVS